VPRQRLGIGLATALGNGSTTIRAAYQGQTGTLPVSVALKASAQLGTQFFSSAVHSARGWT